MVKYLMAADHSVM